MSKRSLICLLTGHVDHGKSQIIESITNCSIIKKEAGSITQKISAIDASEEQIKQGCKTLLNQIKTEIPGILFIDSPGHASFTNLRKRGGNIADMAVLVIDIREGIKPQTIEAIEILKKYKTPFIIAANKIDLISGWTDKSEDLLSDLENQSEQVTTELNTLFYNIVGELYHHGFDADRFDKISDYTKQIAIIPLSAKSKKGIPELLMVLTGLSQKFLEKQLTVDNKEDAKGVILEVRKEKGVGNVISTIIYEGTIKLGDKLIIGGIDQSIETKVKSLFLCSHSKLKKISKAESAAAVELVVPDEGEIFSGMPVRVVDEKTKDAVKREVQEMIEEILIQTDEEGIVLKADSLGSLEAILSLLKEAGIKVKKASVGNITKKDIADAKSGKDETEKIVAGFNVSSVPSSDVKIILGDVIYKIEEDIIDYRKKKEKEAQEKELKKIKKPFKARIMPNCIFRQNNPAVVGVEVEAGILTTDVRILKRDGSILPEINSLQDAGKSTNNVEKEKQVAAAINGVTVGRQINEGDVLYSDIDEKDFRKLKDMKKLLNSDEVELLKEIAEIKRKSNPMWGI